MLPLKLLLPVLGKPVHKFMPQKGTQADLLRVGLWDTVPVFFTVSEPLPYIESNTEHGR